MHALEFVCASTGSNHIGRKRNHLFACQAAQELTKGASGQSRGRQRFDESVGSSVDPYPELRLIHGRYTGDKQGMYRG